MAAAHTPLDRTQKRQQARFERMGLAVRPMPDGRSLLVSLPFSPKPLDSVTGPIRPGRIVFSTVGADQIKCLKPRAFFGLPLIDIRRCADAAAIEATIRQAWRDRMQELLETRSALQRIGVAAEPIAEGSALAFSLPGESPNVRVVMHRLGEALLPSTGPLSGLPLDHPSDRILEVSDCLDSGADLEFRLGQRMHELGANRRELAEAKRQREQVANPAQLGPPPKTRGPVSNHHPKILIVGPHLIAQAPLREELVRQGFRVATSMSESEALTRMATMSPDLVISEYGLGRSDGASLIQAMRGLPGIERIPVVLLDDTRHENRREIARAVGAVGYLTEPIEAVRFVKRLGRLVFEPPDRRFKRYPQRLAARLEGDSRSCLVTELGRGGVFLATPHFIETRTSMRCKMALPAAGRAVIFEGEVRYCADTQGTTRQGIGLRFFEMSAADEATLIQYLASLDSKS